jgi:hypothetical protein
MFSKQVDPAYLPVVHMGAACAGEIVSQTRWAILNTFYLLILGLNHQGICYVPQLHFFETGVLTSYN